MHTKTTTEHGRFCNQIFRNIAISIIAKKFDLYVEYSYKNLIELLGINLYSGSKIFSETKKITDENYMEILNLDTIDFNLYPNDNYFQTKEISQLIYNHLHNSENKISIMNSNLCINKYNNNHIFIHVRLGDVINYNPGFSYFKNAIDKIINENQVIEDILIASDSLEHNLINEIIRYISQNTKNSIIYKLNSTEIVTIMIGCSCKYVILSHGTFSAIIGYLAYNSDIYYPEIKNNWHGDIFSITGWNKINY